MAKIINNAGAGEDKIRVVLSPSTHIGGTTLPLLSTSPFRMMVILGPPFLIPKETISHIIHHFHLPKISHTRTPSTKSPMIGRMGIAIQHLGGIEDKTGRITQISVVKTQEVIKVPTRVPQIITTLKATSHTKVMEDMCSLEAIEDPNIKIGATEKIKTQGSIKIKWKPILEMVKTQGTIHPIKVEAIIGINPIIGTIGEGINPKEWKNLTMTEAIINLSNNFNSKIKEVSREINIHTGKILTTIKLNNKHHMKEASHKEEEAVEEAEVEKYTTNLLCMNNIYNLGIDKGAVEEEGEESPIGCNSLTISFSAVPKEVAKIQ